jgi:hypothetical protein
MRSRWRGLPLLALAAVAAGSDAMPSGTVPEINPTDGPERNVPEPYNGRIRIGIISAATSVSRSWRLFASSLPDAVISQGRTWASSRDPEACGE